MSEQIQCINCSSPYFTPLVTFIKISRLETKSGHEELRAQQGYVCVKCGLGLEDTLKPKEETSPETKSGLIL